MNRFSRIAKIVYVIARYRLDTVFTDSAFPWYIRILFWIAPWRLFVSATKPESVRIRLALESLGPVFIKFGQVLSTRRDLLSDDLAEELRKLQDQVPPFSGEQARELIEKSLQKTVDELFSKFDIEPLASASVAQVHQATLKSGQEVVVKVIRPHIHKIIRKDINLLFSLASLIQAVWKEGRRLRPVEVVTEYEQTIFDELDLRKEAANGSQLRRNFDKSEILYIPEIYWDYTRTNVLVMERISGVPVADIDQLRLQHTDMKLLAERGVEIFFTQVFRDSFFHADMHPGNIFVSRENPAKPQYIAVDFGIIGSLSKEDQSYLARNFLAFFKRDYRMVAQLHVDSGWVPSNTNVDAFETAIRSVCEPIFEKPLKEISFGLVLIGLFQTARRFNMEVQPQLVLLQKTLLSIEGLGRQLYPDLDLWKTAKPFLENWVKQRMGPRGFIRAVKQQSPDWLDKMPQMPQLIFDALNQIRNLETSHRKEIQAYQRLQKQQITQNRRYQYIGILLLIIAIAAGHPGILEWLKQLPTISWLIAIAGLVFILS